MSSLVSPHTHVSAPPAVTVLLRNLNSLKTTLEPSCWASRVWTVSKRHIIVDTVPGSSLVSAKIFRVRQFLVPITRNVKTLRFTISRIRLDFDFNCADCSDEISARSDCLITTRRHRVITIRGWLGIPFAAEKGFRREDVFLLIAIREQLRESAGQVERENQHRNFSFYHLENDFDNWSETISLF